MGAAAGLGFARTRSAGDPGMVEDRRLLKLNTRWG
jgi:hypothetical protein